MRAVVCERLGDPLSDDAALRFTPHHPAPPPGAPLPRGHVRVRVCAASLNFADLLQVAGKYQDRPALPFVVGSDFSGVVVAAAGEGVPAELAAPGTRVCGVGRNAAFAEYAIVPAAGVWRVPDGLALDVAAGVPVAYGTAQLALEGRARLRPGQTLLVLGASGGVGAAAVQLGRAMGARVVAVARGADKARFLREGVGAHAVVDTSALPQPPSGGGETDERALAAAFKAALKEATTGDGGGSSSSSSSSSSSNRPRRPHHPPTADVVFDTVGGAQFSAALRCASWGAQLLSIGFASGAIPRVPANALLVKNATLHGLFWGAHLSDPRAGPEAAAALRASVAGPLAMLAGEAKEAGAGGAGGATTLRVPVSAKLPLERVREAAALMAGRKVTGKVLLIVAPEEGLGRAAGEDAADGGALVGGPPPYPRSRL
jgi:sacsin